jgi:hypothetical protein
MSDSQAALTDDLFDVVGFMVVSAHKLLDEPQHYGPFRLIDAASRLVETLEDHDVGSEALDRIREEIERGKTTCMGSEQEFRTFLEGLVDMVVGELKA